MYNIYSQRAGKPLNCVKRPLLIKTVYIIFIVWSCVTLGGALLAVGLPHRVEPRGAETAVAALGVPADLGTRPEHLTLIHVWRSGGPRREDTRREERREDARRGRKERGHKERGHEFT